MSAQVPVWMSFSIVFVYIMLILFVVVGIQSLLVKLQLGGRYQALLWSIGTFLIAWLSLGIVLAADGFFWTGPEEAAPRVAYAIIPFLLGLGLFVVSPAFRLVIDETPPQWIIGLQINRLLGGLFLVAYILGSLQLPALMAIPAGIGDLLVGLAAPIVAYLFVIKHRHARWLGILWNFAGILDLLIAVATGVATSPGSLHIFSLDAPNMLMSSYPFSIIPAFGVPVWILLHTFSLRALISNRKVAT